MEVIGIDLASAPDMSAVTTNVPLGLKPGDRSPFVVRGSIFASARKHPVSHHLSMAYLTHWMPLPEKPRR